MLSTTHHYIRAQHGFRCLSQLSKCARTKLKHSMVVMTLSPAFAADLCMSAKLSTTLDLRRDGDRTSVPRLEDRRVVHAPEPVKRKKCRAVSATAKLDGTSPEQLRRSSLFPAIAVKRTLSHCLAAPARTGALPSNVPRKVVSSHKLMSETKTMKRLHSTPKPSLRSWEIDRGQGQGQIIAKKK